MAKDRIYQTEDGTRIAPLSALNDFEVAEGYPDIRGWTVVSADGQEVGKVHDLLIDVDHMRTRYLDVRLTKQLASSPGDRDVLVPIGTAEVVDAKKLVRAPLTAERFGLLPMYDYPELSRTHELEVRRHFSLGEAAAAAAAGTAATTAARDFYDNAHEAVTCVFTASSPVRHATMTQIARCRRDFVAVSSPKPVRLAATYPVPGGGAREQRSDCSRP